MFQRGLECALVLLEGPDLPRVKKKKERKRKRKGKVVLAVCPVVLLTHFSSMHSVVEMSIGSHYNLLCVSFEGEGLCSGGLV